MHDVHTNINHSYDSHVLAPLVRSTSVVTRRARVRTSGLHCRAAVHVRHPALNRAHMRTWCDRVPDGKKRPGRELW